MFRSARWRNDKHKIKVVFKFQFHATQVSQLNADTLAISMVPGDIGKPTTRLERGVIGDGTCRWGYPIYETVKFTQDQKTGKIHGRTYHFIVSTGSSKHSLVGEVSIDLASYAEATKVSTLSLPLKNSKSNVVLHVSIQRLQGNICRDLEETEDTNIKIQNRNLHSLLSNDDVEEGIRSNSNEARLLHDVPHDPKLNGDCRTSSGSDITLSSSDSGSGLNTPRELGSRNNNVIQEPSSLMSLRSHTSAFDKPTADSSAAVHAEHQQSQWEWSGDSDHGISTDDSINSSQGTLTRERSQSTSEIEVERLKAEVVALSRQLDLSELELQTLRKQIVKEGKRGQDLTREITGLKQERDALAAECEKLKAFQKRKEDAKNKTKSHFEGGDTRGLLDEIREELNYEKELNANLRLQLQKTQESNAELILAVTDLEEMLEQKNSEVANSSNKAKSSEHPRLRSESDDDEEQKALEELVKEHTDAKEAYLLKQKIMDLSNEIEIYRRDKDEVEMQMEQLALDYEILKQENHDMSYKLEQSELQEQLKQDECSSTFANVNELEAQIESLENELMKQSKEHSGCSLIINELETQIESLEDELKKQSKEHSDSLVAISKLETHIKSLETELEKQSLDFEADLEAVTRAKVEQEQRAIRAEDTLRKTRWKNANAVEKIQEEFKRLSMQMASTFETNEKVAMKALAEANELRIQKSRLEEMLQKANEDLQSVRDDYNAKVVEFSNQLNSKVDQIEQMLMEIDDKSKQLEHHKGNEEKLHGSFSQEILRLKCDIEKLTTENNILTEEAQQKENLEVELQQLKSSTKLSKELVQKSNVERNELASALDLAEKEAEKLMQELNIMKSLKDEKEKAMGTLQTEVETLKAQCDDLKHTLLEDELEKEKFRKQVSQLKCDLKKKEDTIISIESKLKESNKRAAASDNTKSVPRNKKLAPIPHGSKEASNLKDKIKLLEGQIKLKETALETSANSFLVKERDLLNKIEELEDRLEELSQSNGIFYDNACRKLPEDVNGITSNGRLAENVRNTDEHLCSTVQMPEENGEAKSLEKSSCAILSEKEMRTSITSNHNCNGNELESELESLKERNKTMENELKEMQERYSEISLKFAEVEGERQKLVMTIRNLKNAKRG